MSRSSFIMGMLIAAGIHGIILLPSLVPFSSAGPPEQQRGVRVGRVTVVPPEGASEDKGPRGDELTARREAAAPPLEAVVRPRRQEALPGHSGDLLPEGYESETPRLTILWDSPEHLGRVARQLGMTVVAVNSKQEILGEVVADGQLRMQRFSGDLACFSNRVRSLPRTFFGSALPPSSETPGEFWILVPSEVDRQILRAQREAIEQAGLNPRRVQSMEGKFEQTGSSYRLRITRVL